MKKLLLYAALTSLLYGCASTPEPIIEVQRPLFVEFHGLAAEFIGAGGLAVVNISESKSLQLALNQAKSRGRVELAHQLETKIEAMRKTLITETGLQIDDPVLAQFDHATEVLTADQIQNRPARELKYEWIDGIVTAYALLELDPQLILIQLSKENELYIRLQSTQTFETLYNETQTYNAYLAEKLHSAE